MKKVISHRPAPYPIIIILCLTFIYVVSFSNIITYEEGTLDNQVIRVYPDTMFYEIQESSFIVNLTKENLSEEEMVFMGCGFIRSKESSPFLNFEFEGINSNLIKWKYEGSGARYGGGWANSVSPGEIKNLPFNFNEFFDLSKVGTGIIICKGRYDVNYFIWDDIEKSVASNERLGFIYPAPFRIFDNMESQLVKINIKVNPDKWNLNWFHMANNEGVFNVWIEELQENYTAQDIETDTILMNGVLKPIDIKIVSENNKDKMHIKFSKREGISYIGYIESGYKKTINISGQFNDGKWFYGEAQIEITGKQEHNRYQKQKQK